MRIGSLAYVNPNSQIFQKGVGYVTFIVFFCQQRLHCRLRLVKMMFRRFISGNSLGEKKGEDEDGTLHDEEDEEYTEDEEEEDKDDEENIEAMLIPSDHEKKALLASFEAMRKESLFCDVAFISQGVLFRCHRVVVSSWSRWMRTFLCDSPEEEILSLDIFTPDAFQAVLDYMYGYPLQVTEQACKEVFL